MRDGRIPWNRREIPDTLGLQAPQPFWTASNSPAEPPPETTRSGSQQCQRLPEPGNG